MIFFMAISFVLYTNLADYSDLFNKSQKTIT
jgi:hypothetical protein